MLKTVRLAIAADDCRTASGEEQGGGPSLTAARSANRHHVAPQVAPRLGHGTMERALQAILILGFSGSFV